MKKWIVIMGVILFTSTIVSAHEHWIDVTNYILKLKEKIRIYICSGHTFPLSETMLDGKLVANTKVITPDRKEIDYLTKEDAETRSRRLSDEIPLTLTGIYLIQFNLKKPQTKKTIYYAKAIISVGEIAIDKEFDPISYTLDSYLDIIPLKLLNNLHKGDELPLKVLCDNKPLKETLEVSVKLPPEKADIKPVRAEKNFTLKSNKEGIARLKVSCPGKYLITMNYKGIGCSLTFYIPPFRKDKK